MLAQLGQHVMVETPTYWWNRGHCAVQESLFAVPIAQEAAFAPVLILIKFNTLLIRESHYQDLGYKQLKQSYNQKCLEFCSGPHRPIILYLFWIANN